MLCIGSDLLLYCRVVSLCYIGDYNDDDDKWETATSAVMYDMFGIQTVTRDVHDREKLLYRW